MIELIVITVPSINKGLSSLLKPQKGTKNNYLIFTSYYLYVFTHEYEFYSIYNNPVLSEKKTQN